jgi:Helix-turn-helix
MAQSELRRDFFATLTNRQRSMWIRMSRAARTGQQLWPLAKHHRTAIGFLERAERNPRLDTLLAISKGFGITVRIATGPRPESTLRFRYLGLSIFIPDGRASVSRYSMPSDGMQNVSGNSCAFIQ